MKPTVKSIYINTSMVHFLFRMVRNKRMLLFFNIDLEHAIRKVQENQVGLELNRTHQLLVNVNDVDIMGKNINTIKKYTKALLDASQKVGLDVNTVKTKYCSHISSLECRTKS
jgi:hypothetical protein